MSLSALADVIDQSRHDVLSTDIFDTVLLRDHTIESDRLATACRRAAPRLGVDPGALARLRWSFHDNAYRAVAMERPEGEASLGAICAAIAASLGLDADAARLLHQAEVDVDIEHLRPNRPLVELFGRATRAGMRVIAVSDTYYDGADLRRMIDAVVGPGHPITTVYSSADLGLTKHAGRIFDEVGRHEDVAAERILHVGDSHAADVRMARAASWTAVHLPRDTRHRAAKLAGKVASFPIKLRRAM
jgi:FMN phosphatase YigB (HAD superfamily)